MSERRHLLRRLKALKFFILPVAALAFEIYRWKRQDVLHRIIFCAGVAALFALSLIWLESSRRSPRQRRRRHHHNDYR
jgi:anaerobic C4-dicarboxylate transporter